MSQMLINKRHVRKYLLDYARANRHHKFTRVGAIAYVKADAFLREWCQKHVDQLPSSGETIK